MGVNFQASPTMFKQSKNPRASQRETKNHKGKLVYLEVKPFLPCPLPNKQKYKHRSETHTHTHTHTRLLVQKVYPATLDSILAPSRVAPHQFPRILILNLIKRCGIMVPGVGKHIKTNPTWQGKLFLGVCIFEGGRFSENADAAA